MIGLWLTWPAWWPAVLLVPLALGMGAVWARGRRRRTALAFGERETALLGARAHVGLRTGLAALSGACAMLALLRPVTLGDAQRPGAEVVLCLDVSRSMAAGDVAPSRFGLALAEIDALAATAPGSRLALVAFAGTAELVAPLSLDHAAIAQLARALEPGTRCGAGTRLDRAIELGRRVLARGGAAAGAIVLLTDGEEFGADASAAANAARAAGMRVDCLGFGSTAGSKIVVDDGSGETFLRDAAGRDVVTRLDVAALRAVAAAGGGRYVTADAAANLLLLHDRELLPAAATAALRAGRIQPVPCHQWPLFLAGMLWMLRSLLPERRR